ncbi:cardiolipin synthase [Pikeienuella sp. HZG-20]|uniref:cardiolipin synthase n=1 Tax=Paludibacillus litoralis TaxID=3133267 RepID=UPI0030ECDED4
MMTALTAAGAVLLWSAAIFFAIRAIRTARTPQGSVGWVVFLLTAPFIAVPAYLFLGHTRYPGFVLMRRESQRMISALDKQKSAHGAVVASAGRHARSRAAAFERLAGMPIVSGNDVELLIDGAATFGAIFAAIEKAESYVAASFYIIRDDRIGRAFKDLLIARARDGVRVLLIYDALGSVSLRNSYLKDLKAAGVEVCNFHAIRRKLNPFQINFRNHRKIVIVDGKVGFVGGLNVGDEYMGRDPDFGRWRDTHLRLTGPTVTQLQLVFAEDWHWANDEIPEFFWGARSESEGGKALILAPGPADPLETGSLYFCNIIGAATERLWIATPYFVPDVDTLSALKLAALRGVDVRILLPAREDQLLVWLAAFAYFDEVRAAGVEIWRYHDGFMHQKVVVVDDSLASIGTINLDIRSCRLNFEVTALLFDKAAVRKAAEMLEADFRVSRPHETPLSEEKPLKRLGAPIARLFTPLL